MCARPRQPALPYSFSTFLCVSPVWVVSLSQKSGSVELPRLPRVFYNLKSLVASTRSGAPSSNGSTAGREAEWKSGRLSLWSPDDNLLSSSLRMCQVSLLSFVCWCGSRRPLMTPSGALPTTGSSSGQCRHAPGNFATTLEGLATAGTGTRCHHNR
jgi:hypothetical protein